MHFSPILIVGSRKTDLNVNGRIVLMNIRKIEREYVKCSVWWWTFGILDFILRNQFECCWV